MTSERNLASVSQSWFKLSHSASESKNKNIKKIHTLYYFPNSHNVGCENLQHLYLRRLSITLSIEWTMPQTEKGDTLIFQ